MRAIVLESHGGPEVLTPKEVPDPVPGADEVLVDIAATAVNRADLLQRMGLYPGPPMEHEIPGLEFAGTVATVGARVTMWEPGDAVMGIVGGGAYAQRIAVHERQCMAVPPSLGAVRSAAIPEVFITAYDALVLQGGLTAGGWALVHAGASGVGTAAIQLARAVGARVAVTCSEAKVDACLDLGADLAIDRSTGDWVTAVVAATGGVGVDVVLDVVGGDYLARNIRAAAVGGRIVQVGVMGGGQADAPLGEILSKRIALIGTVLRARPLEQKVAVTRRCAHDLLPLFESGALRPVIDEVVSLWDVASAHERVAANATVGKVVLEVD